MNDRDCESCKKFSRNDPHESEGYCQAKRSWVDPQEGEDCKMHEFTLHSATKYKDGTPIMSEPEKVYCETDAMLIHGETEAHGVRKVTELSNQLDYLERAFKGFAKTQDDLIEEYDATLKTHGDTLEQHKERITINESNIDTLFSDVEDLQRKVYAIYQFLNSVEPDFFAKIQDEKFIHKGSDFCGNCVHASHVAPDEAWRCELSGEIVDPDSSSCSMFEPPF